MKNNKIFGLAFSPEFSGNDPLMHIGEKLPVYIDLLSLLQKRGWTVYVLTRKTYLSNSVFNGGWLFKNKKFELTNKRIKADLVYDRTGGIKFPMKDDKCNVVNSLEFKRLAWNKWMAYQLLKQYMQKTFLVRNSGDIKNILDQIPTSKIVIKPVSGLQGIGVFIGDKSKALDYGFSDRYTDYIAQSFIDTSNGIKGITNGFHDLRIVIVNNKLVWSHVRTPAKNSLLANAAQGGELKEVDIKLIPQKILDIVSDVSKFFYKKYSNPIYSLDFGVDKSGSPYIFEINDQMGFPKPGMIAKDLFIKELVVSFESRL